MRKLVLILTLSLLATTASAFSASINPVKTQASPDSPALFQIEVQNNGTETKQYGLSHGFSRSGWVYYNSFKQVQPGETGTFNISVSPGESALQQSYSINFYVTERGTGERRTFSDVVRVQRENLINVKDVEYSSTSIDPGKSVKASITVQNLASSILSDYNITSNMDGDLKTAQGVAFAPGALKTYSFDYVIPEDARPGNRTLDISVNYRGSNQTFSRTLQVREVRNVTRQAEEVNRGLYIAGSVNIANHGNSDVNVSESLRFPGYVEPILSFSEEPSESVENGSATVYTWNSILQPGEEVTIEYDVNYWTPLFLAAVILVGIVLIKNLTGNIVISKTREETEDGVKVSIEIENRSSNAKDVVEIEDFVPNVVDLDEDFEMTKPDLKRTTDGIELEWSLEDFKPGETRVITYRLREKVEVEGGVDLPPAKIVEDGKTVSKSG